MEKTNIELLTEIARSSRRTIEYHEIPYPLSGIRKFPRYKRIVYMPNNPEKTSYFVWYSDPYAKIGYPEIFCGAFIPISSRIRSKVTIRNKNILDNLSILSKKRSNKIGSDFFDSKVIISDKPDTPLKRFLSQSKLQQQILNALVINNTIQVSINEPNIRFVPEFKDLSYMSVVNPQSWYFEKEEIEMLFHYIEKIRRTIHD